MAHNYVALYTPQIFVKLAAKMVLPGSQVETFFYPPPILFPLALISHLPFEWAFFVWTGALLSIAIMVLRVAGLSWIVIMAGIFSPAALLDLVLGQMGIATGALLVAGLIISTRRQALGGSLLGLLICKPQTAMLAPVFLLLQRKARAIGFALLAAISICVAATIICGVGIWHAYLTLGHAATMAILYAPFEPTSFEGWGSSFFWLFRSLHAGVGAALIAQVIAASLAIGILVWTCRIPNLRPEAVAEITVLASLLVTPYAYSADLVGYSLVLALAAERRKWQISMLDTLFWLWPGICLVMSIDTGILLSPLVISAALIRSCWELSSRAEVARLAAVPATGDAKYQTAESLTRSRTK